MTIFHLHIPKCGGTSLDTLLQREYPGWRPIKVWRQMPPDTWIDRWGTPEQVIAADCVAGHFTFGWINLLARQLPPEQRRGASYPTVITMLRDPVERMLSLYHYLREQKQRYQAEVQAMTFAEFALTDRADRAEDWPFLDNDQVRRLCGRQAGERYTVGLPELRGAMRNLEHVPIVGLTERFDDSVARWAERFGWSSTGYEWRMRQPGRLRQRDLDPGLVREVEARQGYDLALYVYALERDWSGEWLDKRPRRI